jgi:hypothetical protein
MTRLIASALAMSALVFAVSSPAMAAKEKFQRTKPHVNVGTIGQTAKPRPPKAAGGLVIVPPWGVVAPHGFDDRRFDLPRETFAPTR